MRPAVSVSGRPDPPQRSWISSAATDTAVSSGVRSPIGLDLGARTPEETEVQANRGPQPREFCLAKACLTEPG